jgi:hypothetical protein
MRENIRSDSKKISECEKRKAFFIAERRFVNVDGEGKTPDFADKKQNGFWNVFQYITLKV